MEPLPYIEIALRIAAALGLGAVVGVEREWGRHPAGLRTMMLVSVGSAGFMLLSMATFAGGSSGTTGEAEISRVIQGLIGGIGFLGAGTIIHNRATAYGLTTAATVLCVAAIGAACGLGHYAIASTLAGATLFTLVFLRYLETAFFPASQNGNKRYRSGSDPKEEDEPKRDHLERQE